MPIGLLAGESFNRALSLGFYFVGAFLAVAGFFLGNRGPLRPLRPDEQPRGSRPLRRATSHEQFESMAVSAVFVLLGFVLMAIGIVVDARLELI